MNDESNLSDVTEDRLLMVIVNSLLKIGIKYKEFIAKVMLIYHKILNTPHLK